MEEKKLLNKFTQALGELKNPIKNAKNPFFSSEYATLDVILDDVRAVFAKQEIAIIQIPVKKEVDFVLQTKVIGHGEIIELGEYPIQPIKTDPQSTGSAITYARRYAICAICGIAAEDDDDGNHATQAVDKKQEKFVEKKQNPLDKEKEMRLFIAGKLKDEFNIPRTKKLTEIDAELKKLFLERLHELTGEADLTKLKGEPLTIAYNKIKGE